MIYNSRDWWLQVHAYAVMAASKLLGRLPAQHAAALRGLLRSGTADRDTDVQQRSCEVSAILDLRGDVPVRVATRCSPPIRTQFVPLYASAPTCLCSSTRQ